MVMYLYMVHDKNLRPLYSFEFYLFPNQEHLGFKNTPPSIVYLLVYFYVGT